MRGRAKREDALAHTAAVGFHIHTKRMEKSLGSRNLIEMKIEQRLIRQICALADALLNPHTSILKAVSDERALGGTHTEHQLHAEEKNGAGALSICAIY
jgi:hypothetical protein